MGIYPCVANTVSWAANNSEGVYKRGVTLGFVIGWGNLNGIVSALRGPPHNVRADSLGQVSSNIYRAEDKPNYRVGHGVVLGYMVLFLLIGSLVTHFALVAENKKRLAGKRDHLIEGKSEQEIEMLGDNRYVCVLVILVLTMLIFTQTELYVYCVKPATARVTRSVMNISL